MINPLNRGNTPDKIAIYKTEPYVIAADVYAEPMHRGRGGWTWYTGSAGWMYQLVIDSFIGLKKEDNTISFKPCIPKEWSSLKITYQYLDIMYHIEIIQTHTTAELTSYKLMVNGEAQPGLSFLLNAEILTEVK